VEPDLRALHLAWHYLETDRPQRALDVVHGLTSIQSFAEEPCAIRVQALLDLERFRDARNAAAQGLEQTPESTMLLGLVARCEAELGNLAAAERAVLQALRLEPEDVSRLCQYADLCARAGDLAKAERLVERATRIAPESPAVLGTRAKLAYLSGDNQRLLADSARLLEDDPESVAGHAFRGVALADQGGVAGAERHMSQVAATLPADGDAAAAAREVRVAAHWLMWPLRPLQRYSPGAIWLTVMAATVVLAVLEQLTAMIGLAVAWVAYCVYSWTVPFLVRRWLRRGRP
jgi:tetratricopeptide (TPR) repeat protein